MHSTVFLTTINQALRLFEECWNNHHVRTEGGMTPRQLFTAGALRLRNSGLVAVYFFDHVSGDYGIDEESISMSDREGVEIPRSRAGVTAEQNCELQQNLSPLSNSKSYGIDFYEQALDIIHRH